MHRNSVDLQFLPPYFSYIGNHNAFSVHVVPSYHACY